MSCEEPINFGTFKKYECILNNKSESFENKVQSLIEVWKSIAELDVKQFDIRYVLQIIDWAKLHALNIVLTGEWRSMKEAYCTALLDTIDKAQSNLRTVNSGFSMRCQNLAHVVKKPWEHPVLTHLLHTKDAEIGSEEIEFFCVETAYLVSVRLKKLCENHCEDLALNLVTNFLACKKLSDGQNFNLNATETQLWFIFDIYIALLFKFQDKGKILQNFEELKLEEGYLLVKRFARKRVRISKIWRNCHKVAIFGSRFFLLRILMKYSESSEKLMKELLENILKIYIFLSNTEALLQQFVSTVRSITSVADAAGLCVLCEVIHLEAGSKIRHFAIEMYIRALTTDMNELEKLKHLNENEKVESTTSRLAQTFTNLSDLLKEHVNVSRECVLTAFSLEPTKARLQQIAELAKQSGFPVIDTGQEWKCQLHPPVLPTDDIAWMCSVCGDWMCKPQLNAPAMQTNTPLNEALQESVLGISEALCDDLAVCLSNPRYQVLSWLLPWTDLYRLCVMYLNNPEKTKNFVTELKYVDIDYSLFQHIKKEPVDEFTGIEKGYEQYLDLNFVSDEEEISSISEDSSQDRALSLGSDGSEDPYYVPQRKSDPKTLKSLRMFRPTIKRKATESESEISEKHFKIDSEQTQSQATTSDSLASTYTLSELLSSSEGASWQKNNSSTLKGSKNGIVATLPPTGGQVAVNSSTSAPRTIKDSTRIELLQLLRNRTNGTNENNENSGSNFNIETNRDSLLSTKQIFAKMVALHNSEDNNQSEPTQPKTMHTISQSTRNYVSKWIQEKWSSCASLQPTVVVTDILASGEYQRWCKPHPPIPPMKELRVSLTKLSEEEIQRLTSPSKKQLDSPEENKVDLVKTVMCKELTVRLTNHIPSAAPAPKEVLEKDELPIVQDSNKITPITEPPNLVDCYNSQYGTSLEDSELEIAKTLAMLEQHTLEAVAKEQMASKAILFNNSKQEPFSMQTITENPTLPMEPDLMDLSNPLVIPDLMDTIQEINHNQIMANQTSVYLPPPQLSLEMEIMPLATLDQVGPLEINTTQNIVSNPSPLEVENQESNSIQEAETPTQTISLKTLEELVFQTSQEITRSQQAILNQSCLTKSESVEPQYKEATQDSQSKHSEHPECRMQRVERIKDTMSMCLEKLETLSAQLNSSQALASTEEIPNQEIQLNQETSEPLETLAQKQIPNPELLERTIAEEPTNKPKLTMEATEHLETVTPQVKQEETCKLEAQLPPKQLPQEHSVMLKPQVKQEEIPNSEFPERTILEQQEVITPQIKQEVISSLEALLRMQEIKQEEVPQHEQAANSQDYLPMVQTIKKEDTCNLETQSPQAAMSSVQLLVREIKEEDVSDQEEIIQMNLLPLELTQWRETIERVPETQSDQERLLFRESLSPEEPKQMLDQEISYPMESIIHKMQEFHLQEHFEKHPKILELNEKAILNPTSQLSLQMPEMTLEAQESDQPEKPLPLDTLEPLETILKPEECNQVEIPQQESQLPLEMPEATQEELFNQETQSYPVETFNLAIQEHKQEEIPHQEPQVSMEITETNQETVVEVFNQELQAPVEILDHIETLIPKSDNSNQVELQQEPHSPMQIIEMEESKEKEMSKQEEHLPLDLVAPIQTLISQSEEFSQVETHPQEAALQLELPEIIQEVEESKEMNIQSPETPLHLEKEDQVQPVTLEAKESNQVETPYQQPHSPLEMPSTIQETEETKEVKFYLEAPIPQEILSPVDPVILEVEESLQVQTPLPETEESHQVETSNQKTEEPLQVETPHQETEQPHSPLEIPIAIQETEEIKEVKFNLEAPIPQELSSPLDPVVLEVKESLRVETPLPETEELHQQPHSPLEMPTTIQGTEETKEANFNVEAPIPQELLSPADPVEESLQVETPLLEAEEPHQVETANQKTQEPLQVETPHQETEELHQVENQQPHSPLETIQETEETKEVNSNLEAPVPQEFSSPVDPVILDVEESLKVETLLLETEESHQVETFNQKTEEPLQVETPHQETEELHQVETQQPRSPLEIPISILETEETKEANLNLEAPIPREILSPVDPVILKVEESLQVETPLLETEESHQVETFNQKTEEPLQVDTPLQETEELHQVETQEAHLPLEISEPNPEMEESMEVITANQETQLPLEILDSIQSVTLETEESKQGEESPPQEIPLETVEKMEQTEESSPQAPIPLETLDPVQPVILETEFNQVETLQEKSCSIPEITETKEIETSNLESQLPLETSDTVKTLVPIVEACNQVEPQHLEPQLPLEISETIKETVEFQEEIKLQLTPVEMPQQESSQLPLETIQELPDSNKTEMLSPGTALALKDLDPVAVSQEAVESCQLESEIISEKLTLNEENLEIKETNISNQEILLEPVGTTIPECKQLPLECPSQETELVEIPPLIQELPENKQVQEECCTQQSQLTLETLEPAEIIIQENKSPQISELSLPTANQITTIIQETQKSVQEELSNQQETESSVVQIEEIQKQEIICNKEKFETLTQEETPIQQLETPMSPILTSIRERLSMCSYPNLPPKLEELKMALEIPIKKESRSPIGTVEKMEYLENQETSATLDCQTVARRKHKLEEEIPLMECSRKIVKGQIKVETEVQDMVCPLKNVERVSSSLNGQEESQSSSLENVPSLATQAEDNSGVDNSVEAENNCDSELSKGAAELLVKEDIGLADTLVINGDECFNVVEEVIEHIPDVKDDSKKRVKKEIVNIYEDDYEMDDFKIDMAKDDSGGVIESFEQFLKSLNKEEKTVDNYKEIPKKSIGYIDDEIFCDLTDYKSEEEFFNISNTNEDSFGFYKYMDDLEKHYKVEDPLPKKNLKIYKNSHKIQHWNVPCFKVDYDNEMQHSSENSDDPNSVCVTCRKVHLNTGDHKIKDLRVMLQRMSTRRKHLEESNILKEKCKRTTKYVMCHCCASPKKRKNTNKSERHYKRRKLSKKISPLLDKNKKESDELAKPLNQNCEKKTYVKKVLKDVPGMKDFDLVSPTNRNHIINVVQVSNSRATSQNTQTSTQISPHIQRIGQPRVVEQKPETSEASTETSTALDTATTSTVTTARPLPTQPSTLINILSQQIIRPGQNAVRRQAPLINILSRQIIRPGQQGQVAQKVAATTDSSVPPQGLRVRKLYVVLSYSKTSKRVYTVLMRPNRVKSI